MEKMHENTPVFTRSGDPRPVNLVSNETESTSNAQAPSAKSRRQLDWYKSALRAVWSSGRASRVLDHDTPEVECHIMAKLSPRRPLTCKPKQANHKLLLYYAIPSHPILVCSIQSYSITFYPVLASYVQFYHILSHPILSYPIPS